ncbi:hypothetical protein, partial [Nostoc sp. UCD120]|uniref:hypothetical protein n=1 Tax=Nostoc sp. UCD120 TaxID=2681312 RepID=UPI001C89D3CC
CLQVQATFLAVFVLVSHTRTNYDLFHYLFSLNRAVLRLAVVFSPAAAYFIHFGGGIWGVGD